MPPSTGRTENLRSRITGAAMATVAPSASTAEARTSSRRNISPVGTACPAATTRALTSMAFAPLRDALASIAERSTAGSPTTEKR
ncbi:hypothetical protein WMF39_30935 [Sorangium sp. So ce1504]|uniref:hypothetical protein n=1 Tax=Sorangium sp. So ce1504 TaxID=3133337 RepID=UPI003F611DF1